MVIGFAEIMDLKLLGSPGTSAHGGGFVFDSIKGSGTTIRITIPLPPVLTAVSTLPSE